MATHASEAWDKLSDELACVDEEYLKRAFIIVWLARGLVDKATTLDMGTLHALKGLDQPFWE